MNFLWRLLTVFASIYVVIFMSEHVFWGNPGTSWEGGWAKILDHINPWSWRAYWIPTYTILVVISLFRVRSIWAVLIVGGFYGWLIEAVVVHTTYLDLPTSISVTGLSWHGPLSVGVVWYLLRRALIEPRPGKTAIVAGLVGLYWAAWGSWWWINDGRVAPFDLWAVYVCVLFAGLALAYWILSIVPAEAFRPTVYEVVILVVLNLLAFFDPKLHLLGKLLHVGFEPKPPVANLLLPVLLITVFVPLWWNRRSETEPNAIVELQKPVRPIQFIALLAMPAASIVLYGLLLKFAPQIRTGPFIYGVQEVIGFVLYGFAAGVVYARWWRARTAVAPV